MTGYRHSLQIVVAAKRPEPQPTQLSRPLRARKDPAPSRSAGPGLRGVRQRQESSVPCTVWHDCLPDGSRRRFGRGSRGCYRILRRLGLELEGEAAVDGEWVDQLVGLDGVRADIAVVRNPDVPGRSPVGRRCRCPARRSISPPSCRAAANYVLTCTNTSPPAGKVASPASTTSPNSYCRTHRSPLLQTTLETALGIRDASHATSNTRQDLSFGGRLHG